MGPGSWMGPGCIWTPVWTNVDGWMPVRPRASPCKRSCRQSRTLFLASRVAAGRRAPCRPRQLGCRATFSAMSDVLNALLSPVTSWFSSAWSPPSTSVSSGSAGATPSSTHEDACECTPEMCSTAPAEETPEVQLQEAVGEASGVVDCNMSEDEDQCESLGLVTVAG